MLSLAPRQLGKIDTGPVMIVALFATFSLPKIKGQKRFFSIFTSKHHPLMLKKSLSDRQEVVFLFPCFFFGGGWLNSSIVPSGKFGEMFFKIAKYEFTQSITKRCFGRWMWATPWNSTFRPWKDAAGNQNMYVTLSPLFFKSELAFFWGLYKGMF